MIESFVIGKIICTFVIFIIIVPVMHSTFPGTDGTGSGESTRQKWLFILFDFPELIADLIQPDRVDSNREFATTVLSNGRWCSPFLFITFYVYTLYPNHCQLSGVDTTAPERERDLQNCLDSELAFFYFIFQPSVERRHEAVLDRLAEEFLPLPFHFVDKDTLAGCCDDTIKDIHHHYIL